MDETTVPTSLSNRKRPERDVRLMVILFIAVVALATVIVLLVMYVVGQFRRESLITTQRACLEFQLPAETVVYEEESARAAQLIARGGVAGGEYVRTRAGEGPPIAAYVPRVWRELLKGASITRPSDFSNDAVLFLHERTTNNGNHVITCVEADRRTRPTPRHAHRAWRRVPRTRAARRPRDPPPTPGRPDPDRHPPATPSRRACPPADAGPTARADLRFFAGQPDAQDATHMILRYETEGRRGAIELWLQDESTVHYVNRRFAGATTLNSR